MRTQAESCVDSYDHSQPQKKRPKHSKQKIQLCPGLSGFLVTTQDVRDDRRCVNECFSLLNQAEQECSSKVEVSTDRDDNLDAKGTASTIEDLFQKEIASLAEGNSIRHASNFHHVTIACKLANYIFNKAASTSTGISRFVQRLIPIQVTCRADSEVLGRKLRELLPNTELSASSPSTSFKVCYKSRYSNSITRDEVINCIGQLLMDTAPQHKANMKNPNVVIVIEIIKSVCCIGILKHFNERHRYNLCQTSQHSQAS
eukprot:gene4061-8444_t